MANLAGSKKLQALVLGLLAAVGVAIANAMGQDPEAAKVLVDQVFKTVVLPLSAYMGGQGLADLGKEKERVARKVE